MAFKLTNPPYKENIVPVYQRDLGPGVLGESLRNQVIILNDKLGFIKKLKVTKMFT